MSKHISYCSTVGLSHQANNTVCQDFSLAWQDDKSNTTVLLCADGLGSAHYSHIGSRVAVKSALRFIQQGMPLEEVFIKSRAYLLQVAKKLKIEPKEFNTTLQIAVLKSSEASFGLVGDGGIVYSLKEQESQHQQHVLIDDGCEYEYVNQTNHLLMSNIQDCVHIEVVSEPLQAFSQVSLFTDGMLPLLVEKNQAHVPFFGYYIQQATKQKLDSLIETVIHHPKVIEKTDDDRTLVTYMKNVIQDESCGGDDEIIHS